MQAITIYDYVLLPFYVLALYIIVFKKSRQYAGTDLKKFFIVAFFLRVVGSVLYSLVVQYYYGYGDSFVYYECTCFMRKAMAESGEFFNVFFMDGPSLSSLAGKYDVSAYGVGTIANGANLAVVKAATVVSYFSFNYYLIISLFFGFFSFIGIWKLFCTFADILGNRSVKLLAYVVLYTPSIWFWGSGLIKESICMGALGWIVNILYRAFVLKKTSLKDILIVIANFYLLFTIKNYIAGILLASLAAGLVAHFIMARDSFLSKSLATLVTLTLGIAIFSVTVSNYMDALVEESTSFIETSKLVYAMEDEQSVGGFAAGDFDLSLQGLIMRTPSAVFTTLYRPFIWETRKPVMMLSALESFLMIAFTFFLLIKFRFFGFFKTLFSSPHLICCLVFSILMGAVVGLTTFNFGTLVRYRLPLLPFYGFILIAIYVLRNDKRAIAMGASVDNI